MVGGPEPAAPILRAMASRQQEKERRRREREEAERRAAAEAQRKRRLGILGGGVLALVVVVVVAVVVTSSSGGPSKATAAPVSLASAAPAAKCTVKSYPKRFQDRGHTLSKVTYKTNPPAFGLHNPIPASDGDYVGRVTPPKEKLVHALEHGRIEIQYRPNTPKTVTDQLERVFNEKTPLMLIFRNQTGMPYEVSAVAWTHILGCPGYNDKVPDAIRAFRDAYIGKGPEKIPQPE
jgi:Protein of unknown function (DUF3105)